MDCDKIIERHALARKGSFTLPLAVEKTVLSRYETHAQESAELVEDLQQRLMAELRERVGEEGEVTSSAFTVSESDGVTYVTLRAECLERIGQTVPLTDAELYEIEMKIPKITED